MISIITVCYNSRATIRRTIESVLNQKSISGDEIEHIFIDGKSKDDTLSIIYGYKNEYDQKGILMSVVSEKDKGAYDAMNKGLRLVTGDFVGILNSDDWYEPETLANVQRMFDNHTGSDIIMGAIYLHNRNHVIIKKARKGFLVTSRHFNHPAMFVRKTCYHDIGFYDNSNTFGDFDWFLRALRQGKNVVYTEDVLTHFYIGGASTKKSLQGALKKIGERYAMYRNNGYPRIYYLECVFQELAKYCLIRQ